MATVQSLKGDIESLKKENSEIKRRLGAIEKDISSGKIAMDEDKRPTPLLGIVLIIVGGLLSLTLIGLLIGLPLLIFGAVLVHRSSSSQQRPKREKIKAKKEAPEMVKTQIPKKPASFEEDVGMKWFAKIGILALVIGIGFFIKFAIDMSWINHVTRIVLGIILGLCLVIIGEALSRNMKYANWAKTLSGGGIAIIYFVIFAAYHFKDYRAATGISQTLDILLLTLVVLFAIFLSLKDNSQTIAAGSFFLGYVTSLLANSFEEMTILYGLLLTAGLVTVVSYKRWPAIGIGGIAASYLMYAIWNADNSYSFMQSGFVLIVFFLAFILQTFFLAKDKDAAGNSIAAILINSAAFFLLFYLQMDKHYPDQTGFFVFTLALFNFLGYHFWMRIKDMRLAALHLYLGIFFITIAIPVQLDRELVTIIWALETLLLTALFLKLNMDELRFSSYILGIGTAFKTLFYDTTSLSRLDMADLLGSTRLFSFMATIICFYIIYKMLKDSRSLPDEESSIPVAYSWAASFFMVLMIFLELSSDHSAWVTALLSVLAAAYLLFSRTQTKELMQQSIAISAILFLKALLIDSWSLDGLDQGFSPAENRIFAFLFALGAFYLMSWYLDKKTRNGIDRMGSAYSYLGTILAFVLVLAETDEIWISVGWSVLALVILLSGLALRKKDLRIQGMIILAITIFKVFIYDTRSLETIYRTISYVVLGVILLLVSFIYTKHREKIKEML